MIRQPLYYQNRPADIPQWLWLYFPPLMLLLLGVTYLVFPEIFTLLMAKDGLQARWALVEHATVAVLLPGIVAGLLLVTKHHHTLPNQYIRLWFLSWTLACIYFAGEEISWGQWLFHWQSPEWFINHNEQHETNLHNISSWLNQKPRALVELWITWACCIVPLYHLVTGKQPEASNWRYWCYASKVCLPAAFCFLLLRIGKSIDIALIQDFTVSSELREYYVALVLSVYLLSAYRRAGNQRI